MNRRENKDENMDPAHQAMVVQRSDHLIHWFHIVDSGSKWIKGTPTNAVYLMNSDLSRWDKGIILLFKQLGEVPCKWTHSGVVVSVLDFRSEGRWFVAQSLP